MIIWDGSCIVHEAFSFDRIVKLSKENPTAKFIAHPESESQVLDIAQYIGSTSGLLNFVEKDSAQKLYRGYRGGNSSRDEKTLSPKNIYSCPGRR